MLAQPLTLDGNMPRLLTRGDVFCSAETIRATDTSTALTITGAILLNSVILCSPAGAATYTLDSAENIRAALQNATNAALVVGSTWRVTFVITTAQTGSVTSTANTGITVNRGSIASNGTKAFLVTVVNGTPAQTLVANTTNASAVITGMTLAQTSALSVGMIVTNSVNGLQGTTIIGIQPGTGVTLSGNANATSTAPGVAISFSPQFQIDGLAA
jgi:hypothetical protein